MANLPPVSIIPAVNFATSTTSVVDTGGKFATAVNNTGSKFATGVNDAGGKLWEQYKTSYIVNLKEKIYQFVNSTTQRCPNKRIKLF
jgi:hypothetical protein